MWDKSFNVVGKPVRTPLGVIGRVLYVTRYKKVNGITEPTCAVVMVTRTLAAVFAFDELQAATEEDYSAYLAQNRNEPEPTGAEKQADTVDAE